MSGFSLAHGAGRKMSRAKALASGKSCYEGTEELINTELDSRVICENKDLLYEEAPEAYKKVEDIVADLVKFKLVKIVAILRPLMTYKFKRDERKHEK
jgi:release factor H-coupled RctB family protein